MAKIPVALLGATGLIGSHYKTLLKDHPFFKLIAMPTRQALETNFQATAKQVANDCGLVFSALPSRIAKGYEEILARKGLPLLSAGSSFRLSSDIPLLIPEVNPDHLDVLPLQQKKRQFKGWIIAKPNCTLQSYLLPLFPLHQAFEITKILVMTLQATSGAGKGFALQNNLLPLIEGEEEKSESEPLKILGKVSSKGIEPRRDLIISAHCNRVPVDVGHISCVSVAFRKVPTRLEILDRWKSFQPLAQKKSLPSAPQCPIVYLEETDRPQPKLDLDRGRGMVVSVGRLRPCPVLDFRFVCLSHNLLRGGAGGGILAMELAYRQGWLS